MAVLKLQNLQPEITTSVAPVVSLTSSGGTCCNTKQN